MMLMAPNGHFLTQIPQPIHKFSEMKAILDAGVTSIHSLPVFTTGQDFLHSWRHFFGLHLSSETIAIRVTFELISSLWDEALSFQRHETSNNKTQRKKEKTANLTKTDGMQQVYGQEERIKSVKYKQNNTDRERENHQNFFSFPFPADASKKTHTQQRQRQKKFFVCVCRNFSLSDAQVWILIRGLPYLPKARFTNHSDVIGHQVLGNNWKLGVDRGFRVAYSYVEVNWYLYSYVLPVRGIFSCPAPIQCVISRSVVLTACFSPLDGVERLAVVWSTRLHPYTTWEESCRWANFCDVSRRGLSLRFFVARFVFFAFSLFRSVAFSLFVFVAMPQRKKIFKPSHARKKFCFSAVFSYSFFHSSSEQLHKFHTRKQRDHIKSN